jgi:hypothetical protein
LVFVCLPLKLIILMKNTKINAGMVEKITRDGDL